MREYFKNQLANPEKTDIERQRFSGVDFDLNELYNFILSNGSLNRYDKTYLVEAPPFKKLESQIKGSAKELQTKSLKIL